MMEPNDNVPRGTSDAKRETTLAYFAKHIRDTQLDRVHLLRSKSAGWHLLDDQLSSHRALGDCGRAMEIGKLKVVAASDLAHGLKPDPKNRRRICRECRWAIASFRTGWSTVVEAIQYLARDGMTEYDIKPLAEAWGVPEKAVRDALNHLTGVGTIRWEHGPYGQTEANGDDSYYYGTYRLPGFLPQGG